jgi:hypothetical protein
MKKVEMLRDEAELVVEILEDNYNTRKFDPANRGLDVAARIRDAFGMPKTKERPE